MCAQVLEGDLETQVIEKKNEVPVREWYGNLMDLHGTTIFKKGEKPEDGTPIWVAFCTNGAVKGNGEAVMGVGVARLMAQKYPNLPGVLGERINPQQGGRNQVVRFAKQHMFTFPHQDHWRNAPQLNRIFASMRQLRAVVDEIKEITPEHPIYIERPGYQPDPTKSLSWVQVAAELIKAGADDRFVFVAPLAAKGGAQAVLDAEL